jgi:hypothetical protein
MEPMNRREALKRTALLVGGAISLPTVSGVLSGCQPSGSDRWSPSTLSAQQNEMVATIAQHIIPETDTPGADAAHVNRFVDAILTGSYLPPDRDRFLAGLDAVDPQAQEAHSSPFLDCTAEQQRSLLTEMDTAVFGPDAEFDPENPPFFRMMKELTLIGYYTSEVGATQELRTNIVPGYYDGCVPFDEIGRAWA